MSTKGRKKPINPKDYNLEDFWGDLEEIWELSKKMGQTQTMLNIALLKARFTGMYDPLDKLDKAKISRGQDGIVDVKIIYYKEIANEVDSSTVMQEETVGEDKGSDLKEVVD